MALYTDNVESVDNGIVKKIDDAAMPLVLDILQRHQYQYPVKSTIRELVSNGLDSNSEKQIALKILSGEAKASDYYEEREGDVYKDSRFDPKYYEAKWLNPESKVVITYHVYGEMEKDAVTIEDTGVGLGSYRLKNYFSLGYSTKRLSRLALGKYGIGNKSPLSLNPYYTVESRYNGQLFRFNVYSATVESIIPALNLETGTTNPFILFDEGLPSEKKIYYLSTTEYNGVKITIESKKHYRPKYEEAVKEQLLYFKDVDFVIEEHVTGNRYPIIFKADILFEDEFIVLAKQKYFNKPHILLNRVNYGYIDFQELELQDIRGSIGIKVLPENVEVTPSREALVWSDSTKAMILQRFKDVQTSAASLVEKELSGETDLLRWLKLCHQLTCSWGDNVDTLLGRLSHLVDLKDVALTYRLNGMPVKYTSKMFDPFKPREISKTTKRLGSKVVDRVHRESLKGLMNLGLPIYFATKTTASNRKDKYLLHTKGTFVVIYKPYFMVEDAEVPEELEDVVVLSSEKEKIADLWNALTTSLDTLDYSKIEVPDDFVASEAEEEDVVEETLTVEEAKVAALSAEERRKLSGKTLVFTPRLAHAGTTALKATPIQGGTGFYNFREDVFHQWQKLEVPTTEIDTWSDSEIYYGTDEDAKLLYFVTWLTQDNRLKTPFEFRCKVAGSTLHNFMKDEIPPEAFRDAYKVSSEEAARCTHFFKPAMGVKLIKVAKQNTKLYKDFQHISKFFFHYKDNQIIMSNFLLRWNTARIIKKDLHKLNFMYSLSGYNTKMEEAYKAVSEYVANNSTDFDLLPAEVLKENSDAYQSMINHLDKLQAFQEFVSSGASPAEVAEVAANTFGSPNVNNSLAVDPTILDTFKTLLEWSEPVQVLLNEMPVLTGGIEANKPFQLQGYNKRVSKSINSQTEQKIVAYLQDKNVT